jgi:hypothetical protein
VIENKQIQSVNIELKQLEMQNFKLKIRYFANFVGFKKELFQNFFVYLLNFNSEGESTKQVLSRIGYCN